MKDPHSNTRYNRKIPPSSPSYARRRHVIPPLNEAYPKFGYPGSKGKLASRIISLFPPHGHRYVEPFCGRANVFFPVAQLLDYKRFWLNDWSPPGLPNTYKFLHSLRHPGGLFPWWIYLNEELYQRMITAKARGQNTIRITTPNPTNPRVKKILRALRGSPSKFERTLRHEFRWAMERKGSPLSVSLNIHILEQLAAWGGAFLETTRRKSRAFDGRPTVRGLFGRAFLAVLIMGRTRPRITNRHYLRVLAECGPGDLVYL